MTDLIVLLSFSIGIASLGIVIVVYHNQSKQSNRIEELISKIYTYVGYQQKKEARIQTDYARIVLGLINYSRMPIHGIYVQIKFLKDLYLQYPDKYKWKVQQFNEEEDRHKQIGMYLDQLRDIITKSSITLELILEIFDEQTQLLYNKMWKMFVYTAPLYQLRDDFYKPLIDFINIGVETSEDLHKIMLGFIPESQKNGYTLQDIKVS